MENALLVCSLSSVSNSLLFTIDIDECEGEENKCGSNAACMNTVGSYTCSCNDGYISTGYACQGKPIKTTLTYTVVGLTKLIGLFSFFFVVVVF